ncbi:LCP family protein [Nocardioides daejeonensis]|uniref:LCP family protein n=1 Tax=Nocardioides daejeonensis TaxID=1046556 RepID=UPI0013A556D2|nr:LCP family protein [Nocardioides daejeonensis]
MSQPADETDESPPAPSRFRSFLHRHRRAGWIALAVVLALLLVVGGYAWRLNSHLSDIDRFSTSTIKNRPAKAPTKALNILLLGSDKGQPVAGAEHTTLAEDAVADSWPVGKYRSDTLMVVHISADREHVQVVSIPRDSFVMIRDSAGTDQHREKINAAFSDWGPNGAIATVEALTGLRLDHVAIIDWAGFRDLSTAVGGVPVTVPEEVYDSKQKKLWKAGDYLLKGEEALQYVRMRYGLTRSDFDRIARQQNFLRSLMREILASGSLTKPLEFDRMLGALTENLTIDEAWTNGDLRSLALGLRGISEGDVDFLTMPIGQERTDPTYGAVLEVDTAKAKELFTALRQDRMSRYLKKYPDDVLAEDDQIS